MRIEYTRHAKRRMRWLQISSEEVEIVLREPDREERLDRATSLCTKLLAVVNRRHQRSGTEHS